MGEFLGWLICIGFAGTLLNYVLKWVQKKYGKVISKNPTGKVVMPILMKVFVRNHKLFGMATITLLLVHFLIQFTQRGLNITGAIAASFMIAQVVLGMVGAFVIKSRKGTWFIAHRVISGVMVLAILIHIL